MQYYEEMHKDSSLKFQFLKKQASLVIHFDNKSFYFIIWSWFCFRPDSGVVACFYFAYLLLILLCTVQLPKPKLNQFEV